MPLPTMPFGKYKGWLIEDLPQGYLEWLVDNVDLRPQLASQVRRELQLRLESVHEHQGYTTQGKDLGPLVTRWYGQLSRRFHPDRGGSDQAMAAVNEARALLVGLLQAEGVLA